MPTGERALIGQRIADLRRRRKLTQRRLADMANVSLSLLSKVEAGSRPATPVLIAAVAPVLRVSVSELSGQPYHHSGKLGRVHLAVPALHGALAYSDIPLGQRIRLRPYAELEADAHKINKLRQSGNYTALGERLPGLVEELSTAVHAGNGVDRERLAHLLSMVYFASHALAYKLGYDQLATIAEDRMVWAAQVSSDPLLMAVANWTRCTSFLATGAATGGTGYAAGLRLLSDTRRDLEPAMSSSASDYLSVYGALHLREGVLSARMNKADEAWAHITAAQELSRRGASDHNPSYQLTCGPTNSKIVEVAVAVELGDGAQAIQRAHDLHIPRGFPAVRASHHFIDLARALLWEGERHRSLEALLQAERYAPQQTRHHPMTHETLGVLVHLERRHPDGLIGLVERVSRTGAQLRN